MTTLRSIFRSSLRSVGVISQNEDMSSEDIDICFEKMRMLFDQWSTNPNLVWTKSIETFTVGSEDSSVQFTSRPIRILEAVFLVNQLSYTMSQIDEGTYIKIPVKNFGLPRQYYWDHDLSIVYAGRGTGAIQLVVQYPLVKTTDLDEEFTMPPGYESAVTYSLACMLASDYGRAIDAGVLALAQQSVNNIVSPNYSPITTTCGSSSMFGGDASSSTDAFYGRTHS